jgi:acetolactate synthase-1/3 small subunit
MVITTSGNEQVLEQIKKQLNKIVNVIKVVDFLGKDYVEREMILVKVKARDDSRAEVLRIADIFRAKVVDVSQNSYTLALTGDQEKLKAFIDLLSPVGIIDFIRTGTIVMEREMQAKRRTEQ